MKPKTLKICVSDTIRVHDGDFGVLKSEPKQADALIKLPYFFVELNPVCTWAPIMARAPSFSNSTLKSSEWQFA